MALGRKKRKDGFITRLLWMINLFFAFLLLLSYLAAYVDPGITTVFAFLGLGYPIILIINVLFFIFWLIRGKRKLILPLLVILIGYNPLIRQIQFLPGREAGGGDDELKVLTYNVQNMTHSNFGSERAEVKQQIIEFIKAEDADICCLQEFSGRKDNSTDVLQSLMNTAGFSHSSYASYNPASDESSYSIVILSELPVVSEGALSLPTDHHNFGAYADLLYQGDTIRVYNLHLESIRLHHDDYQFFEDVSKGQTESGSFGEGSKSIMRKLHNAFKKRARQSKVVKESIRSCPYPIIVCGDFNDTPASYAYHQISEGLEDSFVNAGLGPGITYEGKLPPIRIDYIFHSPYFSSNEFRVHRLDYSDHYPISVFLSRQQ